MPAISTLSLAVGIPGSNTFDSETLNFTAIDPPSWFQLTLLGIAPGAPDIASYEYTVTPPDAPGVYTIELSPGTPAEYIVITITDSGVDVTLTQCVGAMDDNALTPPSVGDWTLLSTAPTGFSFDNTLGLVWMVGTDVVDTYVTLEALDAEEPEYWVIHIVTTQCGIEDDTCQAYPIRIVWLNITGGWSSYIFNGKKTYGVDVQGSKTFKDSDRITRYSQIDGVYDTVVQPSGLIPESHVDFVKGLRYSIQAYVWDAISGGEIVTYPIFNYVRGFELKKQSNGFYKYDFEFSYSTEIITQTR